MVVGLLVGGAIFALRAFLTKGGVLRKPADGPLKGITVVGISVVRMRAFPSCRASTVFRGEGRLGGEHLAKRSFRATVP